MSILENLKNTLKDGTEKVVKLAEDFSDKIKEVGEEGIELSKEVIAEISEKTSDITQVAKCKLEIYEIQKKIDKEFNQLGELVFAIYVSKKKDKHEGKIITQIKNVEVLKKKKLNKTNEYNSLRKSFSQNFVLQKFSDDLAESDSVIDQVLISGNSKAANKLLKDLVFPKKALISAIKRNEEVIIPNGNTKILEDDLVTIICKKNDVKKVINKLD